ncbi:nucleotidyltransferase family protein [Salsuginibacillus kocurii]|uniref:nucleotidyltransferase family protein n=1 Tax=Salsuginibacillus kocurii TaxID=427078 RepID=UPI00037F360E|nr:nucleotidyltransferase family protein [Salsuginibacillus kocurii]
MIGRKVVGIYLAAGKSQRMGENKLALPLGNSTIGSHALKTALRSQLHHIIIVAKEDDNLSWLDESVSQIKYPDSSWSCVRSSRSGSGQAYSLRTGIIEAEQMNADAVVVLLGDQPFITSDRINTLVNMWAQSVAGIQPLDYVASSYKNRMQPPMLLAQPLFMSLKKLEGDQGARVLLRERSFYHGKKVEGEQKAEFIDVDTKSDYEKIRP